MAPKTSWQIWSEITSLSPYVYGWMMLCLNWSELNWLKNTSKHQKYKKNTKTLVSSSIMIRFIGADFHRAMMATSSWGIGPSYTGSQVLGGGPDPPRERAIKGVPLWSNRNIRREVKLFARWQQRCRLSLDYDPIGPDAAAVVSPRQS